MENNQSDSQDNINEEPTSINIDPISIQDQIKKDNEKKKEDDNKKKKKEKSQNLREEVVERKKRLDKIYGSKTVMAADTGSTVLDSIGHSLVNTSSDNKILSGLIESKSPLLHNLAKESILSKNTGIGSEIGSGIIGAGGGIFQGGIKGISSTAKLSKLQRQRQYEKELGGWGKVYQGSQTASLAMRGLYSANLAKNLIAGSVGAIGGGVGGAVSGGLTGAMHGATHGAMATAGLAGSGAIHGVQSTILGGGNHTALSGVLPGLRGNAFMGMSPLALGLMGAQISSSIVTSSKINKLRTVRKSSEMIEREHSLSKYIDPMYRLGIAKNELKMPDQLEYQLLSFIEGHTSVLPSIYSELNAAKQDRDKGSKKGELAYDSKTGISKKSLLNTVTDSVSLLFAKYDPSVQLLNAIVGKISPKRFIEQIKGGPNASFLENKEVKKLSRNVGISMNMVKLLTIKSSNLINSAETYEEKMLMLTAGIYDLNRLIGQESINIRSQGFGITTKFGVVDKKKTLSAKIGGVITNIPGIGALVNIVHDSATLMSKLGSGMKGIIGKIPELAFGKKFLKLANDREALDKEAGIYKSSKEKSTDFISEGLPALIEKIRSITVSQLEMQTNIYSVIKDQYALLYKVYTGKDKKIDYIESLKSEKEERIWDYSEKLMLSSENEIKALQTREDKRTAVLEKNFSSVTSFILKTTNKLFSKQIKTDEELREDFSSYFEKLPQILNHDLNAASKESREEDKANEILYLKKDERMIEQFSLAAEREEEAQKGLGHKINDLIKSTASNSILLASFLGTGGISSIATGLVAVVGGIKHMTDDMQDEEKLKKLREEGDLSKDQIAEIINNNFKSNSMQSDILSQQSSILSNRSDITISNSKRNLVFENMVGKQLTQIITILKNITDNPWKSLVSQVQEQTKNLLKFKDMVSSKFDLVISKIENINLNPVPGPINSSIIHNSIPTKLLQSNNSSDDYVSNNYEYKLTGTDNEINPNIPYLVGESKTGQINPNIPYLVGESKTGETGHEEIIYHNQIIGQKNTRKILNKYSNIIPFKRAAKGTSDDIKKIKEDKSAQTDEKVQIEQVLYLQSINDKMSEILKKIEPNKTKNKGILSTIFNAGALGGRKLFSSLADSIVGIGELLGPMTSALFRGSETSGTSDNIKKIKKDKRSQANEKIQRQQVIYLQSINDKMSEFLNNFAPSKTKKKGILSTIFGWIGSGIKDLFSKLSSSMVGIIGGGIAGISIGGVIQGAVSAAISTAGGWISTAAEALGTSSMGLIAIPAILLTGAVRSILDFVSGYKETKGGMLSKIWGGIEHIFLGSKEGGLGSAMSGAAKYAAMGFAAGSFIPVIGNVTGMIIGGAVGAIIDGLGQNRIVAIGSWIHKWIGGKVLVDAIWKDKTSLANRFGSMGSLIPGLGYTVGLAGGVLGSVFDGILNVFDIETKNEEGRKKGLWKIFKELISKMYHKFGDLISHIPFIGEDLAKAIDPSRSKVNKDMITKVEKDYSHPSKVLNTFGIEDNKSISNISNPARPFDINIPKTSNINNTFNTKNIMSSFDDSDDVEESTAKVNIPNGNISVPINKLIKNKPLTGVKPFVQERIGKSILEYQAKTNTKEPVQINSGYRSIAQQIKLYEKYGPGRAALPGKSMHNFGLAVDMQSSTLDKMDKYGILKDNGLYRPFKSEPWHVEPIGINRKAIKKTGKVEFDSGVTISDIKSNITPNITNSNKTNIINNKSDIKSNNIKSKLSSFHNIDINSIKSNIAKVSNTVKNSKIGTSIKNKFNDIFEKTNLNSVKSDINKSKYNTIIDTNKNSKINKSNTILNKNKLNNILSTRNINPVTNLNSDISRNILNNNNTSKFKSSENLNFNNDINSKINKSNTVLNKNKFNDILSTRNINPVINTSNLNDNIRKFRWNTISNTNLNSDIFGDTLNNNNNSRFDSRENLNFNNDIRKFKWNKNQNNSSFVNINSNPKFQLFKSGIISDMISKLKFDKVLPKNDSVDNIRNVSNNIEGRSKVNDLVSYKNIMRNKIDKVIQNDNIISPQKNENNKTKEANSKDKLITPVVNDINMVHTNTDNNINTNIDPVFDKLVTDLFSSSMNTFTSNILTTALHNDLITI